MKLFDQIIDRLGPKPDKNTPDNDPIRRVLDEGQWAKRSEALELALEKLNEAHYMAETNSDATSQAIIALHRAETLIGLGRYAEAEPILLHMRHQAQNAGQHVQLAYALSMLGTMAQAQNQWEEARAFYEQALKVARTARSMGGEGRAMGHLADTYLHDGNASYAVHLLRDALPKLNLSGDIELSSHFVGQLGQGLIQMGHEAEGERLLYRALRLAEQMKYHRFERHWALALARRARENMRYEEALALYQRALKLFGAITSIQLKTETLCETSRICLYLGEFETALNYARQAIENSEPDTPYSALARGMLGMALRASGQNHEAIPYLERAIAETKMEAANNLQIEIQRSLAAARADQGETDTAIALYRNIIDHTSALPLELAQTHLELALVYEQQREMQTAIKQWKAALTIYESERYHAQAARLYCDIGGARRYLGQGKRAVQEYEQALMMLSSIEDEATRGIVVSNAAIAYADLGDVDSAEAFFDESIQIAHRLKDRAAEATRRGNYGWFLLSSGRPQRAITTLEQALQLSEETGLELQSAVQTDNLGLAYDNMDNPAQALSYHQNALARINELDNPHWAGIIKINTANTWLTLGDAAQARSLLRQAMMSGRQKSDVEVIVRGLIGQTRLALADQQPQEADELLEEAIHLARRADMRRQLAEALQVYSEQQAALDHTDRSLTLWDEAQKLFTIMQMPEANLEPTWLKEKSEYPVG